MAPSRIDPTPATSWPHPTKTPLSNKSVDLSLFPDGIKTSGQHPPLPSHLAPYSAFPKTITGSTLWSPSDYASHPEAWTHTFTASELAELSSAADNILATSTPLTGISKSNFLLPNMSPSLSTMRTELLNGKGFIRYRGLPVASWGPHKSAAAYLGLGAHIGYPVSQNRLGHILGHVKDVGDDARRTDKVRIYRTNARQFFHADEADVVGLLCVHTAAEGGESDLASVHAVWNALQVERPDVAELLTRDDWYFDRKGEVSEGQEGWIRAPVFMLERKGSGTEDKEEAAAARPPGSVTRRVYCKWDPYNATSLARFEDKGEIPTLTARQKEAMQVLEETCARLSLHMVLEVGDIQFLSNAHILHARTAYRDGEGQARRHLMRLWLATPETEGGWRLPFGDSGEMKRGGIQVDDQPPVAKLDAE